MFLGDSHDYSDYGGTALSQRSDIRLVDPRTWRPQDVRDSTSNRLRSREAIEREIDAGLLMLSVIEFDEEHVVAVFSYTFYCGLLCGRGGVSIFDRTESGWKRREQVCGGWLS